MLIVSTLFCSKLVSFIYYAEIFSILVAYQFMSVPITTKVSHQSLVDNKVGNLVCLCGFYRIPGSNLPLHEIVPNHVKDMSDPFLRNVQRHRLNSFINYI